MLKLAVPVFTALILSTACASSTPERPIGSTVDTVDGGAICRDCVTLPQTTGPEGPTIISVALKPLKRNSEKSSYQAFFEFVLSDPQGTSDIESLAIDVFSDLAGTRLADSWTCLPTEDVHADCTRTGNSFLRLTSVPSDAYTATQWPLQVVVIDKAGHTTKAKVHAKVVIRF
jgi:hypothetical protein